MSATEPSLKLKDILKCSDELQTSCFSTWLNERPFTLSGKYQAIRKLVFWDFYQVKEIQLLVDFDPVWTYTVTSTSPTQCSPFEKDEIFPTSFATYSHVSFRLIPLDNCQHCRAKFSFEYMDLTTTKHYRYYNHLYFAVPLTMVSTPQFLTLGNGRVGLSSQDLTEFDQVQNFPQPVQQIHVSEPDQKSFHIFRLDGNIDINNLSTPTTTTNEAKDSWSKQLSKDERFTKMVINVRPTVYIGFGWHKPGPEKLEVLCEMEQYDHVLQFLREHYPSLDVGCCENRHSVDLHKTETAKREKWQNILNQFEDLRKEIFLRRDFVSIIKTFPLFSPPVLPESLPEYDQWCQDQKQMQDLAQASQIRFIGGI